MLARLKQKVADLVQDGQFLLSEIDQVRRQPPKLGGPDPDRARLVRDVIAHYHAWYNGARPLVQLNLPEAFGDFEKLYPVATDRANGLHDSMSNLVDFERTVARQLGILRSIPDALEGTSLWIRDLLARDMYESEFAIARGLLKNQHYRAAGVYAGVALETHLRLMCQKRGIKVDKTEAIDSLNDKLKNHYSKPEPYVLVRWMGGVRNDCAHAGPEPDPEKVRRLVDKAEEFIVTES